MLDTDAVFDVLAVRRRRYVLYALLEADGGLALADLAGLIAAAEASRPITAVAGACRRVAADLARTHLPALDREGLVEYDREREHASLADGHDRATSYLELASRYERPPTAATQGDTEPGR
ncbi:hypothetical protein BRC80_06645 [Halobacteriales archaeon QH_9_66_26]|nr:MAG: hypothetical protein BRC80_06645 [Halobacteriales archaeon QH_9_66_26]